MAATYNFQPYESGENLKRIAEMLDGGFVALIAENSNVSFIQNALKRFEQAALDTGAGMVYSDYYQKFDKEEKLMQTIEYQQGSLRDDFDFGKVLFFDAKLFKECVLDHDSDFKFAGLYDLRLRVSEKAPIFHLNEPLYVVDNKEIINNEKQQFAYVDAKNQEVQKEMEVAVIQHLKRINAIINHKKLKKVKLKMQPFEYEASVIIPVKNREKTIYDCINSALNQKTNFRYNIIAVDNFSDDYTAGYIKTMAKQADKEIVLLTPDEQNLNIGGCWNIAVNHAKCGRFAVQLDSDDMYKDENTLQRIVDEFYKQQCAMLIGSYSMVNQYLELIPPFEVKHLEWTAENGMNNALRVNGFGAPRAFFTPIIRQIQFPNVGYGEDYATALRISREWKVGRIFDSVYLCRRWQNNSDAGITAEKLNTYNFYKDKIRTIELAARIKG
jgi:hypothetical protein